MTNHKPANDTDVLTENHGSIFLFHPLTDAARAWIDAHTPQDAMRFGNALVVEPRYASDIIDGMQADGLRLF